MQSKEYWPIIKETFSEYSTDNVSRLSAALAYYTAFSIAPVLVLILKIASVLWNKASDQEQVKGQLSKFVGPGTADQVQSMMDAAGKHGAGAIATTISIIVLCVGAYTVFGELQSGLNTVWEVKPDPRASIWVTIKNRFLSFAMVLVIAFILLVSLAVSAILQALAHAIGSGAVGAALELGLSVVVSTLLFGAIFKVLPDVHLRWRDVWVGGAFTGVLFTLGKFLLGLYLSHATSAYGAASSFAALLIFIYYSSQILYLGAEFTQAWAKHGGNPLQPAEGAVKVTSEDREQQGIPRPEVVAAREAQQTPAQMEAETCPTPYAAELHGKSSGSKIVPLLLGLVIGKLLPYRTKPAPHVVRRKIIVVRQKPRSLVRAFERGWNAGSRGDS